MFAIETRMKEAEDFRFKETSFLKETVKKLIFALEQSEFQRAKNINNVNISPLSGALNMNNSDNQS